MRLLGRVVDAMGVPMDRLGPLTHVRNEPMLRRPINAMDRDPVRQPLDTGVRAINALLTVGRGQRLGLFEQTGAVVQGVEKAPSQALGGAHGAPGKQQLRGAALADHARQQATGAHVGAG